MGTVAANVGFNFGNTALEQYGQHIPGWSNLSPEVQQALKRVNENAETLMRLISDLLDVSKIEAGQIE